MALSGPTNTVSNDCEYGRLYRLRQARYAHYSEYAMRLRSFATDWPSDRRQSPPSLAEAGFFHAGAADCARCFYCGGGLKNWQEHDIPFVEHARWFPGCKFLRELKGDEFVDNIEQTHPRRNHHETTGDGRDTAKDFHEMIQRVLETPAGLSVIDVFSRPIAEAAIAKTLSDNDWDESRLAITELANVAADIQEKQGRLTKDGEPCLQVSPKHPATVKSSGETERERLLSENRRLQEEMLCRFCRSRPVSAMFLTCGHFLSCEECAAQQSQCPVCHLPVATVVKVFL